MRMPVANQGRPMHMHAGHLFKYIVLYLIKNGFFYNNMDGYSFNKKTYLLNIDCIMSLRFPRCQVPCG